MQEFTKYHTYDLLIAKDQRFEIDCHSGIEYRSKGFILCGVQLV